MNRNGFTFLTAIFMVMIIGIMLGLTGQSWKMIMKREREKELLFRGSQIKEAIENWYAVKPGKHQPIALMDLQYLIEDNLNASGSKQIYLPYTYATKLDEKSPKCAPDCPKIKLMQDPMTGKEWDIIKCDPSSTGHEICKKYPGTNIIIGVASKSKDEPIRTNFKDTALENMGSGNALLPALGTVQTSQNPQPVAPFAGAGESNLSQPPASGSSAAGKITKYSEWKFVADLKNDHSKLYKAYREGW